LHTAIVVVTLVAAVPPAAHITIGRVTLNVSVLKQAVSR